MVVGPVLDALAARRDGTSAIGVFTKNNRLLVAGLSLHHRVLFWLTNLPYWALAAWLADSGRFGHASAAACVAAASSAFHGAQMFGGSSEANGRRTSRLIALDLVCANGYGLALANSAGLGLALRIFAAPVALLTASAVLKRRNAPRGYALCHGAWHLASAAGMWVLLADERLRP